MKRLLLLCLISTASAQTMYEETSIPATGATNTVLGNATNATAAPTYMAVGTCSTAASALKWTTNTGFGCNTSIDAATLGTATFAAPGAIGGGTAAAGSFTALSATSFSFAAGTSFSGASWGTTSPVFNGLAMTLNDTTASGTVTTEAAYTLQAPTFTSTGGASTTITNATALWIGTPVCTGGVVCTNPTSLFTTGKVSLQNGVTVTGNTVNLNASSNAAVNINTGTSNSTTTLGNASSTLAMAAGTVTGGTGMTAFFASPPAIGGTAPAAGSFTTIGATGLISPAATVGVKGTVGADSPAAGSVGEVVSLHCVVGTQAQAATNVTTPVASPGIVTWTSHTFVPSTGLANYTCPINFTTTGALPTGLVVGTNYWIIGSSVSGDTFQVAATAAGAITGTAINFTGSTSGQSSAYIGALTGTGAAANGAALALVAGDWDCSGLAEWQELTSLTAVTRWATGLSTTAGTIGAIGTFLDDHVVSGTVGAFNMYLPAPVLQENVSATTNLFLIDVATFTGTMNDGGLIRCRRMR